MANVNTPDVTEGVPLANRARFAGVTGNMDNGTAQGALSNGNANNNIGGVVYRAAGQSANQFPVSAADVESTGNGGSAPAITTSSNNPLTVQAQTLSRVNTETVAETTPALVSKSSAGNYVTFPSSTEEIALGTGSVNSTSSNLTISREQAANAYVGITDTLTFGNTNDLDVLAEERRVVVDTLPVVQGATLMVLVREQIQ